MVEMDRGGVQVKMGVFVQYLFENTRLFLLLVLSIGFIYRAYPHMFLIPRWIAEEETYFMLVRDLIETGTVRQLKYSAAGESYMVYFVWLVTKINPITICQYINPLLGALTVIPMYFLVKKHLDKKDAYLVCLMYTFSEAVFYRSAHFGSPEISGFLIMVCALCFYDNRKYIPALLLVFLSFFFHLLPFAIGVGVMVCDTFLHKSFKHKLVVGFLCLASVFVFFSPLNPYQVIIRYINVYRLITNLSLENVFIYEFTEILDAIPIFLGMLALLTMSVVGFWKIKRRPTGIFFSMLVIAVLIFIYSWFGYTGDPSMPPTRTIMYFVLPLSYYSLKFEWRKPLMVGLVCGLMVMSAFNGMDVMLLIRGSLSLGEHKALDELQEMGLLDYPTGWWGDYGVQVGTATRSKRGWTWCPISNLTYMEVTFEAANYEETFNRENGFTHVFYSERMKKRAMFLVFYGIEDKRTLVIRKPVEDIWCTMDEWSLFYDNYGVKVYEKVVKDG